MVSEGPCGLGEVLMFLVLGGCLCEFARDHEGGVSPFEGFGPQTGFLGGAARLMSSMRTVWGGLSTSIAGVGSTAGIGAAAHFVRVLVLFSVLR
jgi:hypothetical protein